MQEGRSALLNIYPTNCPTFSFVGFCWDLLQPFFFFLRVTLLQEMYFMFVLVRLREPGACVICFQFMFGFFLPCLAFSSFSE